MSEPVPPVEPFTGGDTLEDQADHLIELVQGLIERVGASTEAVADSNERIAQSNAAIGDLVRYSRRTRRLIQGVIISVVLDVLLSVGLGVSLVSAYNASTQAHDVAAQAKALAIQNQANAKATCVSSNQVRANDITLWTHVLQTSVGPTNQKQIADLQAFVNKTFAQKVC